MPSNWTSSPNEVARGGSSPDTPGRSPCFGAIAAGPVSASRQPLRGAASSAASVERGDAGDGTAEDQRMHVVRALVGVDDLEVDQVACHAELVADAVAAEHVARHAGDVQRLAA